jgi:hypothetical protein
MLSLQDKNMKLVLLGLATVGVVVGVCMNNKKLGQKSTLLCVALTVGVALLVAMNLKEAPVVVAEGFYAEDEEPVVTEEPAVAEEPVVAEEQDEDSVQPRNNTALTQNSVEATPGPVKGPGCVQMDTVSPEDLLPNANSENIWDTPANPGDISGANFLDAGHHLGVNTVGQSLRNANRQLRSEPPNPQVKVSPWQQTTIEPDVNRRPMEIGA